MSGAGEIVSESERMTTGEESVKGRVLSLCDLSGVMVEPWLAAGFDCTIVDTQHPAGVIEYRPNDDWGLLAKVGANVRAWPKHLASKWVLGRVAA